MKVVAYPVKYLQDSHKIFLFGADILVSQRMHPNDTGYHPTSLIFHLAWEASNVNQELDIWGFVQMILEPSCPDITPQDDLCKLPSQKILALQYSTLALDVSMMILNVALKFRIKSLGSERWSPIFFSHIWDSQKKSCIFRVVRNHW